MSREQAKLEAEEADAAPDPLLGQVFAERYRIEARLGAGAMGAVYRARHVKLERRFAVKVLHTALLADARVAKRFHREADLASRLRHPNVIGVVDVGETPAGIHYMVMELAEGTDLGVVIQQAPLAAPRVIHIARQLLEGLYHAHEQGLVHRDIKPENVIIEHDQHGAEVARIVDFGIAILREGVDDAEGGRLTTSGFVLGTPHYMAPEQALGDPLDHRADLFALGITIYEMLCGRLPFDGNGAAIARANLMLDPPAIATRVPGLSVDSLLEAYARRLMAKKRDDRFPTAKAARELLDQIERDPAAAASVLGVDLTVDPAPLTPTAPSPVLRPPVPEDGADGDDGDENDRQVTRSSRPLVAATATRVVRPLTTEGTRRARRGRWVIPAGIAAAVLAVAGVALTRDRPAPPAPIAQAPAPATAPATPTVPAPTPPVAQPPTPTAVTPAPVPTTTAPTTTAPTTTAPTTTRPSGRTRPATTAPAGTTVPPAVATPPPAVVTPATPAVVAPAPAATDEATDKSTLAALYQKLGNDLGTIDPTAAKPLWSRYRVIRLSTALATADSRAEARRALTSLARDIAAARAAR